MRSFRNALLLMTVAATLWLAPAAARAQITGARVEPDSNLYGPLYVTMNGKERKVADVAQTAWVIEGGRRVVYTGRDGAGGYENEGQSLWVYDARTGRRRKVMSEYVMVTEVTEVRTARGRTALLVLMEDGGLGASYLAVVDPDRGEVFKRNWCKIISRRGDQLVLGFYKEDDWDRFAQDPNAKIAPQRTERHDLNRILRRPVIHNKRDN